MKSEMVVVESLEISNLYIKNKEVMNGILCTFSRLYCDRYRPYIPSVILTIMMLT